LRLASSVQTMTVGTNFVWNIDKYHENIVMHVLATR